PGRGAHADLAAQLLDDALHDRQAQTVAVEAIAMEAREGLEHPAPRRVREARAVVADPEANHAVRAGIRAELEPGRRAPVLEAVAQVVEPDPLDPRPIPEGHRPLVRRAD